MASVDARSLLYNHPHLSLSTATLNIEAAISADKLAGRNLDGSVSESPSPKDFADKFLELNIDTEICLESKRNIESQIHQNITNFISISIYISPNQDQIHQIINNDRSSPWDSVKQNYSTGLFEHTIAGLMKHVQPQVYCDDMY